MNKGIVVKMTANHLIVMTPEGTFDKIPRGNRVCEIGEEILFTAPGLKTARPALAVSSTLVAAAVLCLVLFAGLTGALDRKKVVAYVSMDINPSVEMGIDAERTVLELRGLNPDGFRLIDQIDFKGKKIDDVTNGLIERAEQQGYLSKGEADIVIASTAMEEKAAIDENALVESLKEQIDKHIQEVHPQQAAQYQVTTLVTPVEVRENAEKNGVSAGKYAIYLGAKSSGHPIPLDEFKNDSIHTIAKENGGLGNILSAGKPVTKADWKQLVQEESEGLLDKKAEELARHNKEKNDSNGKSNDKDKGTNNRKPDDDPKKPGNSTGTSKANPPIATPAKPALGNTSVNRQDDKKQTDDRKKPEDPKPKVDDQRKSGDDPKKPPDNPRTGGNSRQDSDKNSADTSKNSDKGRDSNSKSTGADKSGVPNNSNSRDAGKSSIPANSKDRDKNSVPDNSKSRDNDKTRDAGSGSNSGGKAREALAAGSEGRLADRSPASDDRNKDNNASAEAHNQNLTDKLKEHLRISDYINPFRR